MFCLHFWFLLCHCNPTDYRGHAGCWGCFVLRTSETVCASEMLHPAIKTPQIKTAYANTFIFSWQTPVQRTWKMSVHCWCLSCAWSSVNESLYLFKKPRSVFTRCPVISCSCWGCLHRLCLSSEQGFPVPLVQAVVAPDTSGGTNLSEFPTLLWGRLWGQGCRGVLSPNRMNQQKCIQWPCKTQQRLPRG